jgi:hypothetical protein
MSFQAAPGPGANTRILCPRYPEIGFL